MHRKVYQVVCKHPSTIQTRLVHDIICDILWDCNLAEAAVEHCINLPLHLNTHRDRLSVLSDMYFFQMYTYVVRIESLHSDKHTLAVPKDPKEGIIIKVQLRKKSRDQCC